MTQLATNDGWQFWKKIGVAFPIKDGSGFSIHIDYIPKEVHRSLKMVILPPLPKKA